MMSTRLAGRLGRVLPAAAGVVVLLAVWQVYATFGPLSQRVLPTPARVVSAGWADRDDIAGNLVATLRSVAAGFAVSVVVAFLLSMALDRSRWARRAIVPLLIGSQTLPIIVLAPLMVLWFGFGLTPKVLLVTLVTFFPIVIALVDGYAASDRDAAILLRTMGAGWWTQFRLLRLPTALPAFFTGLRISVTYAVVAAIFAEYAGAFSGLAVYLQGAQSSGRTDHVLAAVVVSSLLTLALYAVTIGLERLVVPWYHQTRAALR